MVDEELRASDGMRLRFGVGVGVVAPLALVLAPEVAEVGVTVPAVAADGGVRVDVEVLGVVLLVRSDEAGDGWDVDDAEEPPPPPPPSAASAAAEPVEVKDEFGLGAPELGAFLVALDFEFGVTFVGGACDEGSLLGTLSELLRLGAGL